MKPDLYVRFSLMMFLEWFVMGTWISTASNYMETIGMAEAIYWVYSAVPISALISPYFLGLVVDRFFPSEKVLAWLHIIGGIALGLSPFAAESPVSSAPLFIGMIMVHALCFAPTMSLTTSLAFHHMTNQEKQFPIVRVFGTIGWIAAGWLVSLGLHADLTPIPLYIGGLSGIVFGLYSFTLPHTPPPNKGAAISWKKVVDFDALKTLSSRPFWIFLSCVLLIWIVAGAYYPYAPVLIKDMGISDPAFRMTGGQVSEIFFMLVIPLLFARFGVKWMLAAGMGAWVVRYFLFSIAAPQGALWMILVGILLHGVCYDFMFVVGQIYVDKKSTPEIRGQAQGLLIFAMSGVGQLLGTVVTGEMFNQIVEPSPDRLAAWQTYWLIPAIFAAVVTAAFIFFFRDPKVEGRSSVADAAS